MEFVRRDIFLKIEPLGHYSPLAPVTCARHYGRDCMFNPGHESGRVSPQEILGATLAGLVYREYFDTHYTVPNKAKIIPADVNEPPWERRIPGAVLYAKPGERLYIHVLNGDKEDCHSFHLHGLKYGIDSDGAWPLGVMSRDGRRSDEILPGQRWTYIFDATPETIGVWGFHDHSHNVQRNVNRGLFGGLIVRDPSAPCADHEIPLFIHELAGVSGCQFESKRLATNDTFSFTFNEAGVCHYYCAVHGPTMAGQVEVVAGGPASQNVAIGDNFFNPASVTVKPGGTVIWKNGGARDHIVFAAGGGASNFCLNGRAYVGNTPTIVGESGERLRWYLFNLDLGGVWHNFHPHSARWQIALPPGGASDVHSLSPVETFVVDSVVPPALRLPCILEDLQCDPPKEACRVRIKGDFLFHCHIEEHMMAGLGGLVRARQYVWITEEIARQLSIELPYEDGLNECPHVDVLRCHPRRPEPPHHGDEPHGPERPPEGTHRIPADAGAGVAMGGMPGMGGGSVALDISQAAARGMWELLPCEAPVLPVHAALLHTGKVLFFAGSGNDEQFTTGLRSVVWDYDNGAFHQPFTPVDFFCAGQSFLPEGRLLVAGGTKQYDPFIGLEDAYVFDPILEQWIRVQSMTFGRWYPTLLTLGNGHILGVSGGPNRAEIYSSISGWTQLPDRPGWPLYPHMFLVRDGRIFYTGGNVFAHPPGVMPGLWNLATNAFTNVGVPGDFDPGSRDHCASVLLPPAQDQRVLIMGGGDPAINKVHIINLAGGGPTYATAAPMHNKRFHINAVLLPDRTVVVSGGNGTSEQAPTAVLEAEIYDPLTNTWTLAAKAQVARMYHSVALLLADGRVIAAGSNPNRKDDELRLELFHPPYLFKGPRPFIESAPGELQYGQTFTLHTPQAGEIKWVHLIKPMATTHSCDTEQRLVDLEFKRHHFCHLEACVPREPNLAPPGWYMLFIVNRRGVPSVAKWVHLSGK